MNKHRLNQILETLLFPLTDTQMGKQDYLFACYQIYDKVNNKKDDKKISFSKSNQDYRKARNSLVEYLIEKNHWRVKGEDDVEKLCDFFYPMKKIDEYVQWAKTKNNFSEKSMSSYYILRIIPLISNALVTYRDGVAAIRPWLQKKEKENEVEVFSNTSVFNKIEIWNLLCRMCNPDIFIAAAAVESGLGLEALYEQRTTLALADKLLVKSLQNGLAENHLHFNVGYDYDSLWLSYMDLEDLAEKKDKKQSQKDAFIQCALFRYAAAVFIEGKNKDSFIKWINEGAGLGISIRKSIADLYRGESGKVDEQTFFEMITTYYSLSKGNDSAKKDYLLYSVYSKYIEYKTTSEYIFLYQAYQYIKDNSCDFAFSHLFLQYLRLKNEFFAKSHEMNLLQGIRFFQKKYDIAKNELRNTFSREDQIVEILRSQAKIKYLKKLEIRIAPDVDILEIEQFDYNKSKNIILEKLYEQLLTFFKAYRRFILETAFGIGYTNSFLKKEEQGCSNQSQYERAEFEKRLSTVRIPNVGIVFHLLKRKYLEDESRQYCWKTLLNGREWISRHCLPRRYYIRNIALAIEDVRKTIPKIDEYIVGLDAASDENSEEPWMYAMAYQEVRSHKSTVPVIKTGSDYKRLQNMGFTYHVGEDFRHVISGLRHINEVIEEFGYKPGDRLGHATVLGIDMERWIYDNQVVWLPVQEYLENLLWMWGVNIYEDVEVGISLEKIEDRILSIANELYGPAENISVQLLYQVYKEKFNSNHLEIAKKQLESANASFEKSALCCSQTCQYKNGYVGWTKEKLLLTNYCPYFEERYNNVRVVNNAIEDLETYEILQKHLIKKIEKKGIYVETNPTSNLIIGEFPELSKHPIFSLNQNVSDSANHVLVTINSDDPAVFGTNVENELAYIYYAAETKGYAKETILEWIDKIRVHGMNASFIQVNKSADTILNEIEEIIACLKKRK